MNTRWIGLLCWLLLPLPVFAGRAYGAGNGRSWPFHDVATTFHETLGEGWRFRADPEDAGLEQEWFQAGHPRDDWVLADVPGVWGVASAEPVVRAPNQVGWYAMDLALPADADGEAALVFLGAMFMTDAWLDGEYLGSHRGGYTPFLFDLGDRLRAGESKELVVRIDNRLSGETIPKAGGGWTTYGGLTREAFLIVRPLQRVEGLHTASEVDGPEGPARVTVGGTVVNRTGDALEGVLELALHGDEGVAARRRVEVSVAPGDGVPFEALLEPAGPRLWSPDDPFLYELELRWAGAEGPHIRMPLGIREVRVDGPHFLLNGERLWLQGFGQHEMVPGYGPCIPPGWHEQELERIRRFGANHFRAGHHPYHPELYAAADRLGLLVFTEIPVWQLNTRWIQTERAWQEWAQPQLSAMIRWYRNFTSVVSWGAANEMAGAPEYDRRALELIRGKDPTRLPMIVLAATGDMQRLYDILPMAGRNFHYGWYHSPRVYGLRQGLAANLAHARRVDAPIWVAEVGGLAHRRRFTGGYNDESRGSETYLDKIIRFGFQYCATATERVSGIAIWTWSDFIRGGHHPHGIFSYDRQPKLVAYTVRNLFEGDLRVFLAEEETTCSPGDVFRATPFVFNPGLQPVPPGFSIHWRILQGDVTVADGVLLVADGRERAIEAGEIHWSIPEDARGMFSLWAELVDARGRRRHTNAVHFGVGAPPERPGALFLTVTAHGEAVRAEAVLAGVRLDVYEDPGLILPLPEGEYELTVRYDNASQTVPVSMRAGRMNEVEVAF